MRSLVRFVPFLLVMLAAVPAFASISPTIDVQVVATNATTQDISMWVDLHEVGGDCPLAGANPCKRTRISLTVTPAPVGLPATNGSYSITYFAEITPTRSFTLNRGQEYTFTTHTKYEVGKPAAGGTCDTKCTYDADGVANYTATPIPPAPTTPEWEVVPVSVNGFVATATIRLINPNLSNVCSSSSCIRDYMNGSITPIPLAYSGPVTFDEIPIQLLFNGDVGATITVQLIVGTPYIISGNHYTHGLGPELHGGPCSALECSWNEDLPVKTFNPSPVATKPITWGAVKSMYRQ